MNWRFALLISALLGASPHPQPQAAASDARQSMRIDHVIVGTYDLSAGMAELEAMTGVKPVVGGVHPGRGTRNALLSLGSGTYLELLAPNPEEHVSSAEIGELTALKKLKPIGWAVGVGNVATTRSELAKHGIALSEPEPGQRRRSDGSVLKWQTFGYERLEDPLAPFFIHWEQPDLHPARTSPGGCQLISLKLFDPSREPLAAAVRPLELAVRVEKASEPAMELELDCPRGKVRLR